MGGGAGACRGVKEGEPDPNCDAQWLYIFVSLAKLKKGPTHPTDFVTF